MKRSRMLVLAWVFAASSVSATRAESSGDLKGFAPVSVSSANYRETPREILLQRVGAKNRLNPPAREFAPSGVPRYFVFIPGEIFPADLDYETVCGLLTSALAKKNFINAADLRGVIKEPKNVTLMLRVNYGVSLWRLPIVRTEHISWDEGLLGKPHDSRSLTHLGGDIVWNVRAGGNDDALDAGAKNESATRLFGGTAGSSANGQSAAPYSYADASLTAYESSREFNLIVVDAFDYAELKTQGKSAKTLWTTFVAAPVERGQKFSQALGAMLRSAGPYWGETTPGMQVFNDARAEVKIGEVIEVKENALPQK